MRMRAASETVYKWCQTSERRRCATLYELLASVLYRLDYLVIQLTALIHQRAARQGSISRDKALKILRVECQRAALSYYLR